MAARKESSLNAFRTLTRAFKRREFAPLYFFYGEERYFIDTLCAMAVRYAVEEDMRDFNVDLFYGDDLHSSEAIGLCLTPPLMVERRLIIIRRFELMKGKAKWMAYARKPNPHAVVLLICQRRPDLRTKAFKEVKSRARAVDFALLKGNQIAAFMRQQVRAARGTIDDDAVQCMQEYLGTSLHTIVGEIEKLQTFAGERTHLTREDVVQVIGQSREANVWKLQDAVREGRLDDAERITSRLLERSANRNGEGVRIVAMLGSFFTKAWQAYGLMKRHSDGRIAGEMKEKPFVVRKYTAAARQFGFDGLQEAFRVLLAADCELKGESPRDVRVILTLMLQQMRYAAMPRNRGTRRPWN